VIASDASERQIASAPGVDDIDYRVAPAEASGLDGGSVDLVTVSQALHWFDLERFYDEVRRVAAPGAWIAAWAYDLCEIEPGLDRIVRRFYVDTMGPWWPSQRRFVAERYETLPFPFPAVPAPTFLMEAEWSVDAMLGYLGTWSAVRRCRLATGQDPLEPLAPRVRELWGRSSLTVRWPLYLKVAPVQAS
jgi:hypothetical protein